MAVNYRELRRELHRFYDFTNRTVLFVGAGGGQIFDPGCRTKRLIAIDKDGRRLKLDAEELLERRTKEVIVSDFGRVMRSADTVYFEFCLHEMSDPYEALVHARSLAPELVVFDHTANSEWSFYAAEEKQVLSSAEAIKRAGIRRQRTIRVDQRFSDYEQLRVKLASQGKVAMDRIQRFKGAIDIVIPMGCQLSLV